MKFKGINNRIGESSYISINVEGGTNDNNIGDQVWFSPNGKEMEITDMIEELDFKVICSLFSSSSDKMAFKGAMRRMGVSFD